MQPTTLSKGRFALALDCPRKIVYAVNPAYVDAGEENDILDALADGGHQVGALARLMYPQGIEITARGIPEQLAQTASLLQSESVTLFEPTILIDNLLVRIDILVKQGQDVQLIEVKSKGFDPKRKSMHSKGKSGHPVDGGWRSYLYDVAFQTYVLRLARPQWRITPYLMLPDPSAATNLTGVGAALAVRSVGKSVKVEPKAGFDARALAPPLLKVHDVAGLVEDVLVAEMDTRTGPVPFKAFVTDLADKLGKGQEPEPVLGPWCRTCPYLCDPAERSEERRSGWAECLERVYGKPVSYARSETIFALHDFRKTEPLIAKGRVYLGDVEPEDLELENVEGRITKTERHHLQLAEAHGESPGVRLAHETLLAEFRRWRYPLHFIDFETARPVLPFQRGMAPYQQILFQFSHHVLSQDGRLEHRTQYLNAQPGFIPNAETVRALRAALGTKGTVVHWFPHERSVLADMKRQIIAAREPDAEELGRFLDTLGLDKNSRGRLADLGTFMTQTVFLPGSGGKSSIKRFLPALLRQSEFVRDRYGQPVYGTPQMPSLNFPSGWIWVTRTAAGEVQDPYSRLAPLFLDPDINVALAATEEDGEENDFVKNGGAAMFAYATLQDPDLPGPERQRLEGQLLRYCELDSLAMVMVYEALQDWLTPTR